VSVTTRIYACFYASFGENFHVYYPLKMTLMAVVRNSFGLNMAAGLRRSILKSHSARFLSSLNASESILFPNEKAGNEYSTNWAVASCGVAVSGSAFRNLDSGSMGKFAKKLELSPDKNSEYFGGIDADTFAEISSDTCDALSKSENLFLSDVSGAGTVSLRSVSNDVVFANAIQTLLPTTETEPQSFKAAVSLIHTSEKDSEAPGPYVAVGKGLVVVRGSVSLDMIKKGVKEAAAEKLGSEAMEDWQL